MAIISKSLLVSLGAMAGTINAMNMPNGTNSSKPGDTTTWSFAGAEGWSAAQLFSDHAGPVTGVAFTGDSSFVTVSDDTTLRKYSRDGKMFNFDEDYEDHADSITSLAYGGGNVTATAGDDDEIVINGGKCATPCVLDAVDVVDLFFNTNGTRLMAASGSEVMVWDTSAAPPSKLSSLMPGSGDIESAALSGGSLATSSGKVLTLTDVMSGNSTQSLDTACQLQSLAFGMDGTMIAGACDNMIYVFKKGVKGFMSAGTLMIAGEKSHEVTALDFSPDGAHIAAGNVAGELSVWKTANLTETPQTMTCSTGVLSMQFSMKGDLLLVGDDAGGASLLKPPTPPPPTSSAPTESTTESPTESTTESPPSPPTAVVANGSVKLEVDDATSFCSNESSTTGFVKALAEVMELEEKAIDAECVAGAERRLSNFRRLKETVTFEYTITLEIGASMDKAAATDKMEAAVAKLQAMNKTELGNKITTQIQAAGGSATVAVTEISKSALFEKGPDATMTPITSASSTTAAPGNPTTTTTAEPGEKGEESAAISSRNLAMSLIVAAVLAPFA